MKEYIAGGISGITQVLIGYPLDTIKVLNQNKIKLTLNNSLNFKGIKYPLQLAIITNSIVFGLSNKLNNKDNVDNKLYDKKWLDNITNNIGINKYTNIFMNGYISGVVSSPFVYLYDIKKTNAQTNNNNKLKDFIFKTKFNGLYMTMMRESIGYGTYFLMYDIMKNKYENTTFISGGIAGITNWTITYPIDVIKNRQLSNNISIKEACKMGNILGGYKYCLLRAFIVNSVIFSAYEKINSII